MFNNLFANIVKEEFQYLNDRYGFLPPITEDFGREIFVRFERKEQTVSISLEHGNSPLIEIFFPSSETGDNPTPWLEKNGIERSRRFPSIAINSNFKEDDENSMKDYVREMSSAFEEKESEWLKA